MVNMVRSLMNTIDNMKEQVGNGKRELEILRKSQTEMLKVKHCNRNKKFFSCVH